MTKEELNKKIKDLKTEKKLLLKKMDYCSKNGNIYYSITNISKINMMLYRIDNELKKYDFYNFDKEYISYIIYMINEIENYNVLDCDYVNEEYRYIEFSDNSLINYSKSRDEIISVIAKNKGVFSLEFNYYDDFCFRVGKSNNKDFWVLNVRKHDQDLVINSNMFDDKFQYVSEFLNELSNYRLMSGKKDLDLNVITTIMYDIIKKYQNGNKVLIKH